SEDFPEPETPVKATIASRGMSTSTLRRLCSPAPRTRTKPSGGSSDISAGQSTVGGNGGPVEAVGRPGGRRYGGEHRLERHGTRPAGPPPPHCLAASSSAGHRPQRQDGRTAGRAGRPRRARPGTHDDVDGYGVASLGTEDSRTGP